MEEVEHMSAAEYSIELSVTIIDKQMEEIELEKLPE